jgi:glycosyltransferase involved in cell wall biosynthesis
MKLLFDVQSLQNPWSAERGIGRHVHELALALGRGHPQLEPCFVLNRDLPVPVAMTESLLPYGRLAYSDDSDLPTDAIYHVPSPMEPSPIDRVWPPGLRSQPLVVTLHDLIPAVFPDQCMPDPGVRLAYWARVELMRHADRVLSVSQATARDAVQLLGLSPEKLTVTGGGVSAAFRPPTSREDAGRSLRALRPEIDSEFVLYTGGMDYRKNIGAVLSAYGQLPPAVRDRYQLVLVGRLGLDDARGPFWPQAESLGIADRVVFTGFVSDEELVLLYQATSLFVFPSLYEGFGLPVIEALACGAPAIVGRNSSLVELVDQEEALFDPADPASVGAALTRALTEPGLLDRLRRPEAGEQFTWRRIADLTAAAYDEIARSSRPPVPVSKRRKILCVAPLSADAADGETTHRIVEALAARCEVDLLVENRDFEEPADAIGVLSPFGLARIERLREYDATIYWLGNAPEYAFALDVLRSRPGVVIAYNVCLRHLYCPREAITDGAPDAVGGYRAREAIAHSSRFFVHFPSAVSLARVEARSGDEAKIGWLPLPLPRVEAVDSVSPRPVAVFTGPGDEAQADRLFKQLRELGREVTIVRKSRFSASEHSAAVALRGADREPGFVSFLGQCRAARLPTLLFGVTLCDRAPENEVELRGVAPDPELRAALERLKGHSHPVSAAHSDAWVQDVADRLLDEIDESANGRDH